LHHQPAKIAALEAIWQTESPAPLTLFAIPNEREHRNDFALTVPYAGSLILTHDLHGEIKGLDTFREHPPVPPLFFAFRAMVGIGLAMLVVSWYCAWRLRGRGHPPTWMLWILAAMTFAGWAATLSGWIVTEVGRQPWLVTGLLRTVDAAGEISGAQLGASLTAYIFTYIAMFLAYIVVLTHMASHGDGTAAPTGAPVAAAAAAE
jgi:cytochrome d ubiquinol oxidase subunit I